MNTIKKVENKSTSLILENIRNSIKKIPNICPRVIFEEIKIFPTKLLKNHSFLLNREYLIVNLKTAIDRIAAITMYKGVNGIAPGEGTIEAEVCG